MRIGLVATGMVIAVIGTAQAQMAPGGAPVAGTRAGIPQGQLSQEQFNKLQDYATNAQRLTKEDKAKGKTLQQVLAEDKVAAIALTKSMPLSCEVTDAMRVAAGPETVEGKTVQTQTYETTCSNGMGYFLVSQTPAKDYGFSCFATDATAKADIAAKRQPTATCKLPGNADLKVVATKMLAASGYSCNVKNYQWIGQNAANHVEFDEVACDNGQGYMMIVALPGATIPVHIETCNQSAKRGLSCKLSDNGDIGPTRKTFRDALAKNNVACEATDQTTRVIGQIETKKQYVVEFACPQMPKGIVAYIPLDGSKSPFEVLDCPAAARRGAFCALPENKK
jgi:hypothetical protein